ncbi:hypothetical protein RHMOL_Rhmol10G0093300 [Rhododendron molle]|uniref:Uncharacterized protein n=1 Tax=Rhododendron molle TaxID=49168 RepID=A0ACC0M0T1_RHOML|nr:hypothetical protein RHMOL_Rhmol10G0093300 [Rhododendron molle]
MQWIAQMRRVNTTWYPPSVENFPVGRKRSNKTKSLSRHSGLSLPSPLSFSPFKSVLDSPDFKRSLKRVLLKSESLIVDTDGEIKRCDGWSSETEQWNGVITNEEVAGKGQDREAVEDQAGQVAVVDQAGQEAVEDDQRSEDVVEADQMDLVAVVLLGEVGPAVAAVPVVADLVVVGRKEREGVEEEACGESLY